MSSPSDGPELTEPEDVAAYRPRPLLGPTFWAMLALVLLCVLAGIGVANLGAGLFRHAPVARMPPKTATPANIPASAASAPPQRPDGLASAPRAAK